MKKLLALLLALTIVLGLCACGGNKTGAGNGEGGGELTADGRVKLSLGLPTNLTEIGAKAEDIPAMVAHRAQRPNGFPFGNFVKIGAEDMAAIYHLAE